MHQAASSTDYFQEGVDARACGNDLSDNPYCIRTDEHREWAAGWRATFDLDEDDDPASDRDPGHEEEVSLDPGYRPSRRPR